MNERGGGNLPVGPQPPQGPQQPERLSDILPSVLPLAQKFLANQEHAIALKARADERDATLDEKQMLIDAQQWKWRTVFLAGVFGAFFAIAAGLIFYLRERDAGLLVLSHLAALAAGALGGFGWARRKTTDDADGNEAP